MGNCEVACYDKGVDPPGHGTLNVAPSTEACRSYSYDPRIYLIW